MVRLSQGLAPQCLLRFGFSFDLIIKLWDKCYLQSNVPYLPPSLHLHGIQAKYKIDFNHSVNSFYDPSFQCLGQHNATPYQQYTQRRKVSSQVPSLWYQGKHNKIDVCVCARSYLKMLIFNFFDNNFLFYLIIIFIWFLE